jgi:hypothetical protein
MTGCAGDLDHAEAYQTLQVNSSLRPQGLDPAGGTQQGGGQQGGSGLPCDPLPFIEANCGLASCHDTAALTLLKAPLIDNTLGKAGHSLCANFKVVDSANPSNSILISKLTMNPICGGSMLPFAPSITAANIQCITDWAKAVAAGKR